MRSGAVPVVLWAVACGGQDAAPDANVQTSFQATSQVGASGHLHVLTIMCADLGSGDVRYVTSTIFEAFNDAGGARGTMLSTTGVSADVYPVLFLGRDAFGIVALKGQYAVFPMIVNPKPSDSDPLAQRGHAAWKSMQTCVVLNDNFMVRAEVGATA